MNHHVRDVAPQPRDVNVGLKRPVELEPALFRPIACNCLFNITQMLRVWNIYLHLAHLWGKCW